jgi:hypothetical protein
MTLVHVLTAHLPVSASAEHAIRRRRSVARRLRVILGAMTRWERPPRGVDANLLPIACCPAIHTSDGSSVNLHITAVGPHASRGLQQEQKGDP